MVDGRPRLATRERFPDVDDLQVGIPSELVKRIPLRPTTALVLVAHDYKYDLPVLRHALAGEAGYIGMLGSRRRGDAILRMLREEGLSDEALVMTMDDALGRGLFGPGPIAPELRRRLGDILILPYLGHFVWWRERGLIENHFHGHHGGLSAEELITVLGVADSL